MSSEADSGGNGVDLRDAVLELNFVPDWARKPPGEVHFLDRAPRHQAGKRSFERRAEGEHRTGRPRVRREDAPHRPRPVSYSAPEDRKPKVEMPAVDVRFLPERRRLNAVIRQIKISQRAYPIRDVADLFLTKPNSCEVRFECAGGDRPEKLYECRLCRTISLDRQNLIDHLAGVHLQDFFKVEERVGDPPSGKFVCVARCRLSGVILGPPNHHSYASRLQEVYKTKFSHMTLTEYKEHIETSRDEGLINQWKEESSRQTYYTLKESQPDVMPEMDWAGAEAYIINNLAPSNIVATKTAVLPLEIARNIEDDGLVCVAREAWKKENRFPVSLTVALRGAFRSRKLVLFRVGSDAVFVSAIAPVPLDRKHVVSNILDVLTFLDEHPGCNRAELLKGLHPGLEDKTPDAVKALAPLSWLIEKGHIIEFYNGTLSVPKSRN